jgi:hypothetical protein
MPGRFVSPATKSPTPGGIWLMCATIVDASPSHLGRRVPPKVRYLGGHQGGLSGDPAALCAKSTGTIQREADSIGARRNEPCSSRNNRPMENGQLEYGGVTPRRTVMKQLPFLIGSLMAGAFVFSGETALADGLDCFDGSCGGSSGIPECAAGSEEIFWITYANNDANVNEDCISCTNLDKSKDVAVDCRLF